MIDSTYIDKLVSFSLYPNGILPSPIHRARVLDILSPRTAIKLADVAALHANVYPTLPVGVPNRYDQYNYVQLELENGQTIILGLPWINDGTIVTHSNVTFVVTVNNVNAGQLNQLRTALVSNGFDNVDISML